MKKATRKLGRNQYCCRAEEEPRGNREEGGGRGEGAVRADYD
jgi:hypothetical protein